MRSAIALTLMLAACGAPPTKSEPPESTSTQPTVTETTMTTATFDTTAVDTAAIDTAAMDTAATTGTMPPPPLPQPTMARPPSNEAKLREAIEREFADLNPAQNAWNPPKSAKLYERVLVTYRIAPKGTPGDVAADLPGTGAAQTFESTISQRVKVQLAGSAFDIDPKEPVLQTLAPGHACDWSWWVTPNESGEQTLQLKSWLVIDANGADREIAQPPRFHSVDVRFNLFGWMALHWELLASAVLIPLGAWACKEGWQRLRRRGTPGASTER